ncbi:MAG: carboxylating nicotinate-nucleotide diphosphorylase [Candidatus Hadarchaeales archaeon]
MIEKLKRKIAEMLKEDIGLGDVTSLATVDANARGRGMIVVKEDCILAGLPEAAEVFRQVGVRFKALRREGERIRSGEVIAIVEGPARGMLCAERVALNLLMRMSGIATATRHLVELVRSKNRRVKVAATRKTAPLLTHFDKRAVIVGGGVPHRWTLGDHILIKDNHLKFSGTVTEAVTRARRKFPSLRVEVEVKDRREALEAARAGAHMIMFDNMSPSEIRRTVEELKREGLRSKVLLEASGGIDPSNARNFAATGVDLISSGYLTMRAPAVDMGLEIVGLSA